MRGFSAVGLVALVVACACHPQASAPVGDADGDVLRAALESIPFDSIASVGGYRVISIDPRVRRLTTAAPFEAADRDVAFRADSALFSLREPSVQLRWMEDATGTATADTLRASIGIVGSITQAMTEARVIVVISGLGTYGILGSITLVRSGRTWRASQVYFQEG